MIDRPGFDRLDDELTGKPKGSERASDDELVAARLELEGELESDERFVDMLGDTLDAGAADEMLGRESVEAVSAGGISAADAEQAESPDVLTSFLEVERRIKQLVEEKRRLIKERDGLQDELEETMLKMTRSEEKIGELLSIKEEYKTFIDQQEMVRTKVEGLLVLLESEED
ncbi:MAG TPA: hypothetical protein VM163_02135 [bacterium]|nr:hypothetical protein [bacterium]